MIGKTVSHYKILEKLGGGGMGVVYKAQDTNLDRIVALKFLPPHLLLDDEAEKRFISEAKAASALDHPNICTIHDIGKTDDGQLFIVMACYEGETLKKKIEKGFINTEEAIDIVIQIAEGLNKAHQKGIIHRDIKPENIFIANDGIVKILDFGLVKISSQSQITTMGTTMGTVAYMSPEQAKGEVVDHRTDMWSVGIVLYEMLSGELPFKSDYEQAIIYSILNEEPKPISLLNSSVSSQLEEVVTKALAKNRDERFQNIDELLVNLKRLQKELESAGRHSLKGFTKTISGKRIQSFALTSMLILAILLIIAGYFFIFQQKESQERISVVVIDFINETGEKELNSLSGLLITSLEQSRRLSVATRTRMFDILNKLGKQDVERIDESLGRDICKQENINALVTASIRKLGRRYAIDLKVIDPQKDEFIFTGKEEDEGQESIFSIIDRLAVRTRRALRERATDIQEVNQKVAEVTTSNLEAYQYYFKGQEFISKLKFNKAQEEFKKAIAVDSTFGLAYYRLAYAISWRLGSEEIAKEPLEKALTLIERIPEKERYLVRAVKTKLEKGEDAGIAILKEMEQIYPNDKEMLFNIGDWFYHSGKFTTAIEYFEKVLQIDANHRRALQHLTWTYRDTRSYDKMLQWAQRYSSVAVSLQSFYLLGDAAAAIGDFGVALKTLEQFHELLPEDDNIIRVMSDFYIYQGQYDKAEEMLRMLTEEHQPLQVRASGYGRLALFFLPYLGKYREAMKACDKLIELNLQQNDISRTASVRIDKALLRVWGWNDMDTAWKEADQTFQLQNQITTIRYWEQLVQLAIFRKDYILAESIVNQWLKRDIKAYDALIHSAKGECVSAESLVDSVLVTNRKYIRIFVLYAVSRCEFEAGRLENAVKYLHQLQDKGLSDNRGGFRAVYYPKSFYLLGQVYAKMGKQNLAIKNYQKFLNLWKNADPDLDDLINAKLRVAELKAMAQI